MAGPCRWTYCPACGSLAWLPRGQELHTRLGTCPSPGRWLCQEEMDRLEAECDLLNDLEDVADPEPADCQGAP